MPVNEIETPWENSIFDSPKWCSLFPDKTRTFGCFKGNELIGTITGFERNSEFISGNYPLTYAQGIVIRDKSNELSVAKQLASFLKSNYERITIVNYDFTDIRPFLWEGFKPIVKYTYLVKEVKLEKDTRYEINKATRSGIEVRPGTIDEFWDTYKDTFERKNLDLPVDRVWLERFNRDIEPKVFCAGGAAVVFISDLVRDYYIFGATRQEALGTGASLLCLYTAIKRETDFVGCNVENIGLYKRGFGGELKVCLGVTNV